MSEPGSSDESSISTPPAGGAKQKVMISSYTILIVITLLVGLATIVLARVVPGVTAASLSDILVSPISGFLDGIEVSLFLLILGGCLGIVNKLGALDAGIAALVKALHGRETVLIAAIMAVFASWALPTASARRPFRFTRCFPRRFTLPASIPWSPPRRCCSVPAWAASLHGEPLRRGRGHRFARQRGHRGQPGHRHRPGSHPHRGELRHLALFILRYANKVRRDKGSTILSLQEQQAAEEAYGKDAVASTQETLEFTGKRKVALALFGISFVVMICGFIPWEDFGVTIFTAGGVWDEAGEVWATMPWSGLLTGNPIGEWYFNDASVWFFIMAIIIGVFGGLRENEIVDGFLDGAADMIGVALMVGLSRAISILMGETGLDVVILDSASSALAGTSALVFGPLSYLVYLGLSVVITSTSALATISMPILGPLAANLGFSPEVIIAIFCAANGLANLFSRRPCSCRAYCSLACSIPPGSSGRSCRSS